MKLKALLCASASGVIGLSALLPAAAYAQTVPVADPGAQSSVDDYLANDPDSSEDTAATPASQGGLDQTTEGGENAIVVTGYRRSLESAQEIKRNSDGIVDAIVAEDIGKLPDTFASSALQRVSGVTVTRGGGEAAGVTVRGLPDLTTTYNGRQIFTAEGRYVAIQDFPAGTVAALEVYKSGTADMIEGGIAGEVNVRGRRPFDFNGFELSGSLNGVNWEQSGKLSWNGNLLISDRWDTGIGEIGVLVNASYVGLDFQDSTREQSLVIATANDMNAPGTGGGFRYPDAQALYYGTGHRWRPSANAAVQWRPSSELEFYVDGLFQGFRSEDANQFLFVPIFGDLQLTNVTFRDGNPNQAQSATVTNAFRPDGFYGATNGKTDTYQIGGGAVWERDRLKISGDIAYTDSTFMLNARNIDFLFASSPVRNVNFDGGDDGGPLFAFQNFDLTDPANFLSRGFFQEYLLVGGQDIQTRADATYDVSDTGLLRRLQFGIRYSDRDANRDRGAPYIYNGDARIPITDLPVDVGTVHPGFRFGGGFQPRTFTGVSASEIVDNVDALRDFFGAPEGLPGFSPTENFAANEKSYAAYGQLKYGFDLGSIVVDGLAGLRVIKTKTRTTGFSRILDGNGVESFPAADAESEYTDYLPNISARVGLTNELQLRLAYTQTRTRPNFFDLRPSLNLNSPPVIDPTSPCAINPTTPQCANSNRRGGSTGNPNLRPLMSNNYDASLEYYFSNTGSATLALFRREADGFVSSIPVNSDDPVFGPLRIDTPLNLGNTTLQGAEVSFTSFLDIDGLPEWAKAFGLQANLTYIDAKGDLAPSLAATLGDEPQPFPGVSEFAYNVIALYERPFLSARLAYNYRSKFAQYYSIEPLDPVAHAVIEKGRGQLDFSTSVTPVENVTIAFDIVNLLGNPLQRYRQYDEASGATYPRQILYLERTYSLGVRFRF
ncbi:TonB-dependent receptor [Novosphingopyxis sp.]|uniref:TonB-dependent receptor n=1 Tax=Novosphingopyxis sp. TaxID=2709690 RepID=UPI003B5AFD73